MGSKVLAATSINFNGVPQISTEQFVRNVKEEMLISGCNAMCVETKVNADNVKAASKECGCPQSFINRFQKAQKLEFTI